MTYKEIKQKQKRIAELKLRIEQLRVDAESITQKLSPAPAGGGVSDKVGNAATMITHYEQMIANLKAEIGAALENIPDTIEGTCIKLRVTKHYSWTKLSLVIGGNITPDGIRKKIFRYFW